MKADPGAHEEAVVEVQGETPEIKSQVGEGSTEADAERSAENIRVWLSFLPQDCVDTMIKMGWDRTT